MEKNLKEIECEIAALKIIIKSLLSTLNNKQRYDMLGNISLIIEDRSNKHPKFNDVINLTEQYVKKLMQT